MDRETIRDQVRLLTLVESTQVTDAEINTIINQGLYEIGVQFDWPFLYTSSDLSLVDSAQGIALPNDFQRYIALVDDDHDETIEFVSPDQFFFRVGNDTGNEATSFNFWTIYGDNILLSPTPSSNDTNRLTLYYYKGITILSQDTDEPEFNAAYHWALVEYGKSKLYEREEYYSEAEQSFNAFARYLDDMASFYSRRGDVSPAIYGNGGRHRRGNLNLPWWNRF